MAIHTPDTSLSANDKRILNALFDPETFPSSVSRAKDASQIDASLPPHPSISSSQLSTLETRQSNLVRTISSKSDIRVINSALDELNEIANHCPDYPSVYVNRAMLQRMKLEALIRDSDTIFSAPSSHPQVTSVFTDLSQAIKLSLPSTSPKAPVSPYQAHMLRTAFSHRAYLYLKAAETGVAWQGKEKSELEEMASEDFTIAAKYGDEVAREMSVRTNPYAKMCGAIVRNALKEESEGADVGV